PRRVVRGDTAALVALPLGRPVPLVALLGGELGERAMRITRDRIAGFAERDAQAQEAHAGDRTAAERRLTRPHRVVLPLHEEGLERLHRRTILFVEVERALEATLLLVAIDREERPRIDLDPALLVAPPSFGAVFDRHFGRAGEEARALGEERRRARQDP